MPDFIQLLNFEKAAAILGATPADVRVLVVEERTLPALYVTQVGHKEPFQYQLLRVDDIGQAFDMAAGGIDSTICTSFLRIERAELNRYLEKLATPTAPEQATPTRKLLESPKAALFLRGPIPLDWLGSAASLPGKRSEPPTLANQC